MCFLNRYSRCRRKYIQLLIFDLINLQGACALNHTVTDYDTSLTQSVLSSLRNIKMEIESKNYRKADMWGHLGKVIIRDPDEGERSDITGKRFQEGSSLVAFV